MKENLFAYHRTHVQGPFSGLYYFTDLKRGAVGDHLYVLSADKASKNAPADYFLEGVFRITSNAPGIAPAKSKVNRGKYELRLESIRRPENPIPLHEGLDWFDRKHFRDFFASGQSLNPITKTKPYLKGFDELLQQHAHDTLEQAPSLNEMADLLQKLSTERHALAKIRTAQQLFRKEVIKFWQLDEECCVLTGTNIREVLVASHIVPWAKAGDHERIDGANGLLLIAHADRLFDQHLLSFRASGTQFLCEFHPRFGAKLLPYGIKKGMPLKSDRLSPGEMRRLTTYLEQHYQIFSEKKGQS